MNKKKKKASNASVQSIASSGSGDFVQTSALSQPLIFQPHNRPNTSAHQVRISHPIHTYPHRSNIKQNGKLNL